MQPTISNHKGFTLIEVIVTTAIVGVISVISASAYTGYIETTKNSQAANQIRTLSLIIDDYALENGVYPDSFRDIGNENIKDPWGNPYIYFNLKSENGQSVNGENNEYGGSGSSEDGSSDEYGGSSDHESSYEYGGSSDHESSDEYGGNSHHESSDEYGGSSHHESSDEYEGSSDHESSDEYGGSSEHGGSYIGSARKDGKLVPINTNYDLYSFGKDNKSKAPLRAKDSHDDIIYANDGGYIGLASEF